MFQANLNSLICLKNTALLLTLVNTRSSQWKNFYQKFVKNFTQSLHLRSSPKQLRFKKSNMTDKGINTTLYISIWKKIMKNHVSMTIVLYTNFLKRKYKQLSHILSKLTGHLLVQFWTWKQEK